MLRGEESGVPQQVTIATRGFIQKINILPRESREFQFRAYS
jgi:hypothetical protein